MNDYRISLTTIRIRTSASSQGWVFFTISELDAGTLIAMELAARSPEASIVAGDESKRE